jgi:hypothetical protein
MHLSPWYFPTFGTINEMQNVLGYENGMKINFFRGFVAILLRNSKCISHCGCFFRRSLIYFELFVFICQEVTYLKTRKNFTYLRIFYHFYNHILKLQKTTMLGHHHSKCALAPFC